MCSKFPLIIPNILYALLTFPEYVHQNLIRT